MQKFYTIILQSFKRKSIESGFYFVVVCGVAYLAYVNIPKFFTWIIVRDEVEINRLHREVRECDSINRANNAAMIDRLKDCYQNK